MHEPQWQFFKTGDTPFIVLADEKGYLGAWLPDIQRGRIRPQYPLIAEIGQGAKSITPKEFYDFCDGQNISTTLSLREFARVAGRSVYKLDTVASVFVDCARQRIGEILPFMRPAQRGLCLSITGA